MASFSRSLVTTAAVAGSVLSAAPLFTAVQHHQSSTAPNNALRGAGDAASPGDVSGPSPASHHAEGVAIVSVAGVAVAAAASLRSAKGQQQVHHKRRAALFAEPISAAAAAAGAAKAATGAKAAVAGAKAASSAVGAGAGTGKSLSKEEDVEPKLGFNPETEIGAMAPLGYFDPLGFSKVGDEAGFRNLRAAEIKHGRVAMMAAVGAVAQHYVVFPGFETVPKGLGAVVAAPGAYGFAALFAVSGVLELSVWSQSADKEPGNFGDPLGLNQYNDEMRAREINNGRFAMFAAIGIISAELYTGKDAIQQFGLAALGPDMAHGSGAGFVGSSTSRFSKGQHARNVQRIRHFAEPVSAAAAAAAAGKAAAGVKAAAAGAKAAGSAVGAGAGTGKSLTKEEDMEPKPGFNPETEIGAMAPLGYFDPLGFSKVGDEAGFRNLRAAEIKHGRVAMMAAVGAVVQHYVVFPGFETVPKGLGATAASPGAYGFAALVVVSGLLELSVWSQSADKEPGNFGDPLGLNQYTEEMRAREINNGRFAMFAAIGIIAAELYTGKDAVEQFGL